MSVPLLDLTRQPAAITEGLRAAFERVLASGHFIMGPEIEALERECAAYLGARHALAVSSGTDAILLALMALGIGPGDEVICPSYTFFATAGCVWRVGAKPVFVDSLPESYNLDPAAVEAKITAKTKAILPVHLFGQPAELGAILAVAAKHGIPVIEDAAQSIGAKYQDRATGTFGAIGCFSFFPTKNLGALGDGGLVTTEDDALAEAMRTLRVHGSKVKYHHETVGANFRLDALQAAFLRVKLPHLEAAHAARRAHAARYTERFLASGLAAFPEKGKAAPLLLPFVCQPGHIYNQYVVRVPGKRDALRDHLKAHGIATEVYYPIPLHLQECFASLGHKPGDLPWSETFARETVALPVFPELRPDEVDAVADALVAFLK